MHRDAARVTESGFLKTVTELASVRGWRWYHQRPARTANGWRTAMSGHVGFPDLVLVRGNRLIFAELKVGRNTPDSEQREWLQRLSAVPGIEVCVWRPNQWPAIERALL